MTHNFIDPAQIATGVPIAPIDRLKVLSPLAWEEVVLEWLDSLTSKYGQVERLGGSGDKGRDVIATVTPDDPKSPWDNFQCKHYANPLVPSDIWIELAKLCHFTYVSEYTIPRYYKFVAPLGVGTGLAQLLKNPDKLKEKLLDNWNKVCAGALVVGQQIELNDDLRAHINTIDFRIFGYVTPLEFIRGHSKTPYHAVRFGGGLPQRPPTPDPPAEPSDAETCYVLQLMAAYADHLQLPMIEHYNLEPRLQNHFVRARQSFYCAEALRGFARDNVPSGTFEGLQTQIFDGVIDTCEAPHACGFTRVTETTSQATRLALTSSPLIGNLNIADRHGICHQLVNESRLIWILTHD